MNTEQIVPFLEGKEPFDQKALAQIMLLLEKYPYFQTGHMFLLKAMHSTQSENYSNQLMISGSFISDKRKLFQFINSESNISPVIEKEKTEVKSSQNVIEKTSNTISSQKDLVEIPPVKIEKEIKSVIAEKDNTLIKNYKEQGILIDKSEETIIKTEKASNVEKAVIEEKSITESIIEGEITSKKLEDLSEEDILLRANENSKKRHKEIITDFFQSTINKQIEKKEIEPQKEIKIKKEPVQIEREKKLETPIINENKKIEQVQTTDLKEVPILKEVQKLEKSDVLEIPKEKEIQKTEETKREKIDIKEIKHEKLDIIEVEPIEKVEIKQEITSKELPVEINSKQEQLEIIEKTEIKEPIKELKEKNLTSPSKSEAASEVMNSIFSKIRQIKKEMNLNTENAPETIDIKSGNEKISFSKIKTTEEKKSTGRVIKESFIGGEINLEKEQNNEETDETNVVEKEEIKEIGITAKDLFKQHIKNKEQTTNDTTISESSKLNVTTPISRVLTSINEEKTNKTEISIEKEQTPVKEIIKNEIETIKTINTTTSSKTSAADSLLRKIEEKKQRLKEEKEREEQQKLLDKQNEDEQLQQLNIAGEIKELTGITEPIIETNLESVEDNQENINKPEIKVNKTSKLIDSFIEKIETFEKIGSKESTLTGDISISSADEKEEFMTETMADIQIQQKNYPKAIEIYQKLILKFPEKKTYFAIQIKKVESLIKS